jgi:hypothetical protein
LSFMTIIAIDSPAKRNKAYVNPHVQDWHISKSTCSLS